tara:strand:- start:1658 stop:1972 length:315 start_codon:yes stop_codon:yes gene_type:complete
MTIQQEQELDAWCHRCDKHFSADTEEGGDDGSEEEEWVCNSCFNDCRDEEDEDMELLREWCRKFQERYCSLSLEDAMDKAREDGLLVDERNHNPNISDEEEEQE